MSSAQLIRNTWESISEGGFDALEAVLAPDARWRAVEDGPWNCENRAAGVLDGSIEEITEFGDRAIVAFRPRHEGGNDAWPLEDGIRYVVVTTEGGLVTELKGCANRQVALEYVDSATRR